MVKKKKKKRFDSFSKFLKTNAADKPAILYSWCCQAIRREADFVKDVSSSVILLKIVISSSIDFFVYFQVWKYPVQFAVSLCSDLRSLFRKHCPIVAKMAARLWGLIAWPVFFGVTSKSMFMADKLHTLKHLGRWTYRKQSINKSSHRVRQFRQRSSQTLTAMSKRKSKAQFTLIRWVVFLFFFYTRYCRMGVYSFCFFFPNVCNTQKDDSEIL